MLPDDRIRKATQQIGDLFENLGLCSERNYCHEAEADKKSFSLLRKIAPNAYAQKASQQDEVTDIGKNPDLCGEPPNKENLQKQHHKTDEKQADVLFAHETFPQCFGISYGLSVKSIYPAVLFRSPSENGWQKKASTDESLFILLVKLDEIEPTTS
jgi:hypothetical protein